MLIQNIHLENAIECCDIRVENGVFTQIGTNLAAKDKDEVCIDGSNKMILPPFVESHVHLDTTQTAGEPDWNRSGTLFEGIELWSKRKEQLSIADVKERALVSIKKQIAAGVQYIRSHVDVTDPNLTALRALIELREELKDIVTLQLVAFPQEGILSYPNGKELLEKAVQLGADCIGAIPHFEFTREYSVESLNFALDLAVKYDKLVDVHCDEIDDPESRGLETLATRALELGLFDKVTASHTTAMHSYNNAYVIRLMRLLEMSKINFVANPLVNTHLQGRVDSYPKRRGVTRVKELLAANCNVSFGHDDIKDPWYPLGTGDLRDVVFLGLHVCQMMGYEEIMDSYKLITHNGAKTLHLKDYGVKVGNSANFLIIDAPDFYTALNEKRAITSSYRAGKLIYSKVPAQGQLHINI